MTGSGDPAFTKNFNPYTATGLPSGTIVQGAFYEPLTITPLGGLPTRGWLARTWKWSRGAKTLTLNLVHNAKWSDGKPLTSADVVYSLNAGKQDKIMDRVGLTGDDNNIASVKAKGKYGVAINLKTPDSQFISSTLNRQFVIPKHVWTKVKDAGDVHELEARQLRALQRDQAVHEPGLRPRQEPALLEEGRTEDRVPRVRAGLVQRFRAGADPERAGRLDAQLRPERREGVRGEGQEALPLVLCDDAYPISLLLDTTKYPYSIVAFRKALSLAIDRKTVSKLGEYGYAPPTDALALRWLFPQWVKSKKIKARAATMAKYSPNAAKKMLTDAGFKYSGGKLIDPHGDRVKLDIHVISGWSDWVASNQIITRNLRDIGIDSNVALEPDWGAWQPSAYATKFPTLLWQGGSAGSPYGYFYANLSKNAYVPPGQDASRTGNWSHFTDAKATNLLSQWKVTLNPKKQQSIATKLQGIFLDKLPIVPLFIGPRWSTYSTKYFHCFNTPRNFYGDPIFTTFPDNILSFTRICPGGKAG